MKLDIDALSTFYEMARGGADLAATRLAAMTGIQTRVRVTRLNFTTPATIENELDDGVRKYGIKVGLDDGLSGTSLLVFDEAGAEDVAGTLAAELREDLRGEVFESAITEVAQIMNNGFVDGWANVLNTEIDVTAPTFVAGDSPGELLEPDDMPEVRDELAVAFRSKLDAVDTDMRFQHYLLPERESVSQLFQRHSGDRSIDYNKLAGFDRMAQRGAEEVATNLTKMTDMETGIDVRRINFVSLDAIPGEVTNAELVSVAFSFDGGVSGYLLFLLDQYSAERLVEATVGELPHDGGFGDLGEDAIQELCNIMASGLLDGWANMLDTKIDHSTPAYAHDMGAAVVDPLIVGLVEHQEFAFVFDTKIDAEDTAFDVDIYVIPDEDDLRDALDILDVEQVDDASVSADYAVEDADANPEEVSGGDLL
jgi:chemotaxis protein CheC